MKKQNTVRKTLVGEVIKLSSDKTIKVKIEKTFSHPKYSKIMKSHKSYLVHNDGSKGDVVVGNTVKIREIPPVSKTKNWELLEIIK